MIDAETRRLRVEVLALAASLGAEVLHGAYGKRRYEVLVLAPPRHVWASESLHQLVDGVFVGPWSYADPWRSALERMRDGVEPCAGADCDCLD